MAEGAFYFSLMTVLVKLLGKRIPSHEIVVARTLVTFLLSSYGLWRGGISPLAGNRKMLLTRGLAGFLALQCYLFSLVRLPLGEATLIQYTSPVFTTAFAALWLGEPAGRGVVTGSAVSLLGLIAVARPAAIFGAGASSMPALDLAVATAGAVFAGFAYTVIRKLRATDHPLVVVWSVPAVGLPLALPTLLYGAVMPQGWEWAALLGIGGLTQIGQLRMTQALHLEPAGRAASVTYLQVLFAAFWSVVLFREPPTLYTALGAACILGGTVLLTRAPYARPTHRA